MSIADVAGDSQFIGSLHMVLVTHGLAPGSAMPQAGAESAELTHASRRRAFAGAGRNGGLLWRLTQRVGVKMQSYFAIVGVVCLLLNGAAAARQLQRTPKAPVWPDTYQVLCEHCNSTCMLHVALHHTCIARSPPWHDTCEDANIATFLTE